MSTETFAAQFVTKGREVVSKTLSEIAARQSGRGDLPIEDIRLGQSMTRLSHNLDALERGDERPYSSEDEQARDFAQAQIDRIEALGDKATAKDFPHAPRSDEAAPRDRTPRRPTRRP